MTTDPNAILLAVRKNKQITLYLRRKGNAPWNYAAVGRIDDDSFHPYANTAEVDSTQIADALSCLREFEADGWAGAPMRLSPQSMEQAAASYSTVLALCLYADFFKNLAVARKAIGELATVPIRMPLRLPEHRLGLEAMRDFDLGYLGFSSQTDKFIDRFLDALAQIAVDPNQEVIGNLPRNVRTLSDILRRAGRRAKLKRLKLLAESISARKKPTASAQ